MASVSQLVINDHTVAPHLELLRRICDPNSTSKPHITVRYFDKLEVPGDHLQTQVDHVDLVKPGIFDSTESCHRVVFIRCDAEELVRLEHKPHFPESAFHVTLYEGDDVDFAKNLLETLDGFGWMLRAHLPANTTLTHIQLKRGKTRGRRRPSINPAVQRLFLALTNRSLTWRAIDELTGTERLRLAHAVCASLHHSATRLGARPVARDLDDGAGDSALDLGWDPEVHLTPPELATAIARYALSLVEPPDAPIHFGDPAVGNGAFYAAALQRLPKERIASAVGVDVHPRQVEAARARWGHRGLEVMRADYLHLERLAPRTLILANPPYLRHQDIPAPYKMRLRERASVIADTLVDGKSGQYVYFLILSHRWLAEGGVAAWLIPSGFMRSQYGRGVRRYLTEEVALIRVHQFGASDPQFENAKVLPAVVVFRKAVPDARQGVTLSSGGTLEAPSSKRVVTIGALRTEERWSATPAEQGDEVEGCVRVGDLFSVRRGIATGANSFFVLRRERARALGLPSAALRPILPKSRQLETDVIERGEDGWPIVEPQLCVIDCDWSEEEVAARSPALHGYLAKADELGIRARNLVRSRRPWYRQERRMPAMFLCTYMGRGSSKRLPLRFLWNKSEAIATNAYLMLYPRTELASILADKDAVRAEVYAMLRRAAVSTIGEFSRLYSGGLQKIEPRELLDVVLPEPPGWLQRVAGEGAVGGRLWAEGGGA